MKPAVQVLREMYRDCWVNYPSTLAYAERNGLDLGQAHTLMMLAMEVMPDEEVDELLKVKK